MLETTIWDHLNVNIKKRKKKKDFDILKQGNVMILL